MKPIKLPIVWVTEEFEQKNDLFERIGIDNEISDNDKKIVEFDFYDITLVIPENYEGKNYSRIIIACGTEFICALSPDEIEKKVYDSIHVFVDSIENIT